MHPWNQRLAPNNARALVGQAKVRVQCLKCGRWFAMNGVGRHKAACLGPKEDPVARHHENCTCGNIKAAGTRTCFRCEDLDSRVDWATLNRLAGGRV